MTALHRFVLAVAATLFASPLLALDTARPDVRAFVDEMVARNGMDRTELNRLFAGVESKQAILDAISRPAERTIPWFEYRERFLTPQRIQKGIAFWKQHPERLAAVTAAGLPAQIAVGILGVETSFGEITGRYRVIDALSTLAFDYPPRSPFFRGELEQFLLLVREEAVDPLKAIGSYAGAMGAPQFMPTSYRKWAVDADADGHRDLWSNWDDVIGSIANYFKDHGWRAGEPVSVPATMKDPDLSRFTVGIELNETIQSLKDKGVEFEIDLPPSTPALLVVGQGRDAPEYRVGFNNFFVITRYNRSPMYAMAVYDLGQAIASQVTDAR
ncbi:MAG: lytic murein transglycosylase B [Steroidobacteraceae bacterium]